MRLHSSLSSESIGSIFCDLGLYRGTSGYVETGATTRSGVISEPAFRGAQALRLVPSPSHIVFSQFSCHQRPAAFQSSHSGAIHCAAVGQLGLYQERFGREGNVLYLLLKVDTNLYTLTK